MSMPSKFTPKVESTPSKLKKVAPVKKSMTVSSSLPIGPTTGGKPKKFTKASGKMKIKAKGKNPFHEFFVS